MLRIDSVNKRLLIGAAVFIAGALLSAGPPELTLRNDSLRIDYALAHAGGALLAAAGAGFAAWYAPRRALRLVFASVAVLATGVSIHLAAYRVEVGADEIRTSGLFDSGRIAWTNVTRVDAGPGVIIVFEGTAARVHIDTTDYRPEQRASLERTLTRRARETSVRLTFGENLE
jgi:hypothetical protein